MRPSAVHELQAAAQLPELLAPGHARSQPQDRGLQLGGGVRADHGEVRQLGDGRQRGRATNARCHPFGDQQADRAGEGAERQSHPEPRPERGYYGPVDLGDVRGGRGELRVVQTGDLPGQHRTGRAAQGAGGLGVRIQRGQLQQVGVGHHLGGHPLGELAGRTRVRGRHQLQHLLRHLWSLHHFGERPQLLLGEHQLLVVLVALLDIPEREGDGRGAFIHRGRQQHRSRSDTESDRCADANDQPSFGDGA